MFGKLRFISRNTKLLTLIVLTTYTTTAFEFLCPHPSQRRFRAKGICNGTQMSSYSCLYDIYQHIFIETCNQTVDYVVRGERYVISGSRLGTPCSSDRYQPFNFWSNDQTQCYYQKSSCVEKGQFIYSQMSTIDDSACLCDYTQGFSFVTEPKDPCSCIPSQEDCTCFKRNCPENTKVSSDYKCISSEINDNGGMCKALQLSSYSSSSESSVTVADLGSSVNNANRSYAIERFIIMIITIVIIIIISSSSITAVFGFCPWSKQSSAIKHTLDQQETNIAQTDRSKQTKGIAISADFVSQPKSFFARNSENIPMAWTAKKVKLSVISSENTETLVFSERITYCAKWFIQEFALYHIPNTKEFLPLTDDVHTRVEKSVSNGGFIRVFELYLCSETIIRCVPQHKREIEVKLLVEPYHGKESFTGKTRETHEQLLSDVLNIQKEVLIKEMQPSILKRQFQTEGIELETQLTGSREDMAEEMLSEIVQKNLSERFIEILKNQKEMTYLYNRLNSLIATFCKKQDVFGNIVSNMVEITESKIDLDSFQQRLIQRNVLADQDFCSICNENQVIEIIVRIRRTDERAIGYFIDALYDSYYNELADRLLRRDDKCLEGENADTVIFIEDENILLEARIQFNIIST